MLLIIKHIIAGLFLLAGSVHDLKSREVSDWANYSLIALGFATNIVFSFLYDVSYILESLAGFGIGFTIALLMYYTGQWGGGDAKLLMGIGALYGFWPSNWFLVLFLVYTAFAGAIYGLGWSIWLVIKHWKAFIKTYEHIAKSTRQIRNYLLIATILTLAGVLFFPETATLFIFTLSFLGYLLLFLWGAIKAIEESCMKKYVTPDKLTEGDWIAEDVKVKNRIIASEKDLGVTKEQLQELNKLYKQKKVTKVLIKEGIPFVPSFLFGWILAILIGNPLF